MWTIHDPAQVRVPPGAISPPQYEALKQIPGVQPWWERQTEILCPVSAAWIVEQALTQWGVPHEITIPAHLRNLGAHVPPEELARVLAQPRTTEAAVYPWVLHDFGLDFQFRAAARLALMRRGHLWAEPGAGKTLMAILWALALWEMGEVDVIVNVTIATVVAQATDEWERFSRASVLEVRPPSRRKKSAPDFADHVLDARSKGVPPVWVTGWEVMRDHREAMLAALGTRRVAVVFDETQRAKNPRRMEWTIADDGKPSGQDLHTVSAAAAKLARAATAVLSTTATPIANSVMDLWAQADLVEPGGWGMTARRFRDRYCETEANPYAPHAPKVVGVDAGRREELLGRLSFRTHQIPYDVSHANLPDKRRELVRVRLEDQIKEQGGYNRELRKLANVTDPKAQARSIHVQTARAASRKRSFVVKDLTYRLDVGKGKIIAFVGWRQEAEYLGNGLRGAVEKRGGKVWVSHGGATRKEREEVRKAYLAHPGPAVLVGTWQAWGTGLNLDDTDTIAFVQTPVKPSEIAQGEGRGDRVSMTRQLTFVFYVAEGTIDERLVEIVVGKMDQTEAITTGTRLSAFGGIRKTLDPDADMDALLATMIDRMASDVLLDDEEAA